MRTLRVRDVLKDRILVSRESARRLEEALRAAVARPSINEGLDGNVQVIVDFDQVEGMAPSFLDELLSVFDSLIAGQASGPARSLIVKNPPTRLSLKFEAIARGHGMSVQSLSDGSWSLTNPGCSDA